jgi:hypothetical protein
MNLSLCRETLAGNCFNDDQWSPSSGSRRRHRLGCLNFAGHRPADAHAGHHCGPEERECVDAVQPPQPGNRVGEEAKRHLEHSEPEDDQCP